MLNKIQITRKNFHKLNETFVDLGLNSIVETFKVTPLTNIASRFNNYVQKIPNAKIDNKLVKTLEIIQSEYNNNPIIDNEKFLLRILGIVCNTVFIGPEYFHLDVCNPCNLRCNYCWFYSQHLEKQWSNEFKKRMIDYNDFTSLVDDLYKLETDTILFTGAGEPFLHPRINDMIKFVKSKNIKLQIFTNGTLIDKKTINTIIQSKTDELFISVSASNPKTYVKVHPRQRKDMFIKTENNIKNLVKQKNRKPNIVLLFVLCKDNYKDIIEMADWSFKLGVDSCRYQIAHNDYAKNIELNNKQKVYVRKQLKKVIQKYKGNRLHINPNILFQLENTKKDNEWYKTHFTNKGCYVGWFFSRLWADNMYSFCCIRKEVEHYKHRNSFFSLWNSKKYKKYRQAGKSFAKNNIELSENYYLIDKDCSHCGNYEVNEKVNDFFKQNKNLQGL